MCHVFSPQNVLIICRCCFLYSNSASEGTCVGRMVNCHIITVLLQFIAVLSRSNRSLKCENEPLHSDFPIVLPIVFKLSQINKVSAKHVCHKHVLRINESFGLSVVCMKAIYRSEGMPLCGGSTGERLHPINLG